MVGVQRDDLTGDQPEHAAGETEDQRVERERADHHRILGALFDQLEDEATPLAAGEQERVVSEHDARHQRDHAEQQRHLPFGERDVPEQVPFGIDRTRVQLGPVAGGEGALDLRFAPGLRLDQDARDAA